MQHVPVVNDRMIYCNTFSLKHKIEMMHIQYVKSYVFVCWSALTFIVYILTFFIFKAELLTYCFK